MKNFLKLFGFFAPAAIIGFSFVTCDVGDDGGGNSNGNGNDNGGNQTPTASHFNISGTGTVWLVVFPKKSHI